MLSGIIGALGTHFVRETLNGITNISDTAGGKGDFAKLLSGMGENADGAGTVQESHVAQTVAEKSAKDSFMEYQSMSMAEKIRASYLAQKGLTEEDLANLPPEALRKIEDDIKDAIKRKLDPNHS